MDAVFLPFDVEPQNLAGLIDGYRECENLVGGSVTVPYKVDVIPHLDGLDPKAQQIGAVNTIVRESDGRLIGYNTCLLYTSPSPRDGLLSRMPSSA